MSCRRGRILLIQGFDLCNTAVILLKKREKLSGNRNEGAKGGEANAGSTEKRSQVSVVLGPHVQENQIQMQLCCSLIQ